MLFGARPGVSQGSEERKVPQRDALSVNISCSPVVLGCGKKTHSWGKNVGVDKLPLEAPFDRGQETCSLQTLCLGSPQEPRIAAGIACVSQHSASDFTEGVLLSKKRRCLGFSSVFNSKLVNILVGHVTF